MATSTRGPIRPVPYSPIQTHLLGREITTHRVDPFHVPNRDIVDVVRDPIRRPHDPVPVKILGRVEPQVVALLPPPIGAPVSVEICLEQPPLAVDVAQELEIDLVAVVGVFVAVARVEGDDDAGGVVLRQL